MTDDLVARLRDMCGRDGILKCRDIYDTDVAAAADRIEQLEKGFRDILKSNDDALIMSFIARACLHGFIDAQGRYCYVPFSALGEKTNDQ
jgi:hypothetical protein